MKIKELKGILKEKSIDNVLFFNLGYGKKDPAVFYFLQKEIEFGCLVLGKDDFLIVNAAENIKSKVRIEKMPKKKKLFEVLNKKLKGRTIGLNMEFVSVNLFKKLKKGVKGKRFKDISKILMDLRKTKTAGEIGLIRRSCKISDSILKAFMKNFKKFKSPLEASLFLKGETGKRGCELAFPPIITQSFKTLHPRPSKDKFKKGFCIVDFGVRHRGYCSDITRTLYIGKPSEKEKEIYNLILSVQRDVIKNLKMNKKISMVMKDLKRGLGEYEKHLSHGLGHGIGVEVHEPPNLKEESKERIGENMVFTIEPGVYFRGIGIRIEDDILIKKGKTEVLTKTKKELVAI